MTIWFDMDGTIANLYGVPNWLAYLVAENVKPYAEAETLVNMNSLARILNRLQRNGYNLGIISWTAKNGKPQYNEAVAEAKKRWLAKHLASVQFDRIEIVPYGYKKSNFAETENDILFDDEEQNRNEWTGTAYDVQKIVEILKSLK